MLTYKVSREEGLWMVIHQEYNAAVESFSLKENAELHRRLMENAYGKRAPRSPMLLANRKRKLRFWAEVISIMRERGMVV